MLDRTTIFCMARTADTLRADRDVGSGQRATEEALVLREVNSVVGGAVGRVRRATLPFLLCRKDGRANLASGRYFRQLLGY